MGTGVPDQGWRISVLAIWILAGLAIVSLIGISLLSMRTFSGGGGAGSPVSSESSVVRILEAELGEIQSRLDSVVAPGQGDIEAQRVLSELSSRVSELTSRIESLRDHQDSEGRLHVLSTQAASQAANSMAGMVQVLSILFTLVLFGVTLVTGFHTKEMRDEWTGLRSTVEATRDGISAMATEVRVEADKSMRTAIAAGQAASEVARDIEARVAEAKQRIDSLADGWQSELRRLRDQRDSLLGFTTGLTAAMPEALKAILVEITHEAPLTPEATGRIEKQIGVFGARLKILHPEPRMRLVGIDELGASGTKIAELLLRKLLESSEGAELLQIQRAIRQNSDILRPLPKSDASGSADTAGDHRRVRKRR